MILVQTLPSTGECMYSNEAIWERGFPPSLCTHLKNTSAVEIALPYLEKEFKSTLDLWLLLHSAIPPSGEHTVDLNDCAVHCSSSLTPQAAWCMATTKPQSWSLAPGPWELRLPQPCWHPSCLTPLDHHQKNKPTAQALRGWLESRQGDTGEMRLSVMLGKNKWLLLRFH